MLRLSRILQETDDDRPSANDSDLTIPRELKMLDRQKRKSLDNKLDYASSATASSSSDQKRGYHRRRVRELK